MERSMEVELQRNPGLSSPEPMHPFPAALPQGKLNPFYLKCPTVILLFCFVVVVENSLLLRCCSFILFNLASLLISISSKKTGTHGSH